MLLDGILYPEFCKSLYCLWNQPCENFAVHFATVETESLEKSTLGKKGLFLKSSKFQKN